MPYASLALTGRPIFGDPAWIAERDNVAALNEIVALRRRLRDCNAHEKPCAECDGKGGAEHQDGDERLWRPCAWCRGRGVVYVPIPEDAEGIAAELKRLRALAKELLD